MNKYSRISLAAMTCGALLASAQVHAQSSGLDTPQNPTSPTYGVGTGTGAAAGSGGMSNSMGTNSGTAGTGASGSTSGSTSGSSYDSSSNNLQPLPTEPTGAGYNSTGSRYSWIPYTTSGYVGIGLGNGKIDVDCVPGTSCEDPEGAVSIYTGGMFNPYFGVQLGYFRLGDTERNGGETKISGVNIGLVGVAPLGTQFSLVGRVGGTYGWTEVTAGVGVLTATGDEKGFAPSFGAGLSWDFSRNMSATIDWDRHNLRYPGGDKKNTDIATIGLKYRF